MTHILFNLIGVLFFLLRPQVQAQNSSFFPESLSADRVRIKLIAPQSFSSSQETLVGVLFEPDPEWHVYWKNPGDSGAAPKFRFDAQNAEVGPIQWPIPKRLPIAHLTNLGYEGSVAYLFSIKPTNQSEVNIIVDLEWLVCKEDCIPGFGKIQIRRPVNALQSEWKQSDLRIVQNFAKHIPSPAELAPFKIQSLRIKNNTLAVKIQSDEHDKVNAAFMSMDIFPIDGEYVSPALPEKNLKTQEFILKANPQSTIKNLSFVLTTPDGAWEFSNVMLGNLQESTSSSISIWILLISAAAGGLLLNLMPCVFPVIFIKAFSLLKTHGPERLKDCLLYSLGVLTAFTALGVIFLILRYLGSSIGWGFQLQSPLVILFLVLLFWTMALNFLGTFEFGTSVMNLAGRYSKGTSAFGTGILSVFIAAPCTGPFMGTALGAASTLPVVFAFLVFFFLGFGLCLPFLIFAIAPRTLSWLPKPGAWMESVKQFFAFPLFATVIWLLWILGQQTNTQGWLLASILLLILSFCFWLGKQSNRLMKTIAWALAFLAIISVASQIKIETSTNVKTTSTWQNYDEKNLLEARKKGQAVFVDFTAAWCITCQINKQIVLDTAAAQEIFKRSKVLLMRADWTSYDPSITEALAKFGRNSVPVYVFYPADGSEPRLLPQILTLSMIENLESTP